MPEFSHDQTVIITVFTRPDKDGRGQTKVTRRVEIARFEAGQIHEAFCVLEAELDRLNQESEVAGKAFNADFASE